MSLVARLRGAHIRTKRTALMGFSSVISLAINVLVSYFSVPIILHHLGPDRFGVWLILLSLISLVLLFEFGLGTTALVNLISEAHGQDDPEKARRVVATSFWSLMLVSLPLAILAMLAGPYLPWTLWLHGNALDPQELIRAGTLALALAALSTPPVLVLRSLHLGLQRGYLQDLWDGLYAFVWLGLLIWACHQPPSLPLLVICMQGTRLLWAALQALHVFVFVWPELAPWPRFFSRPLGNRLVRLGSGYFLSSLSYATMTSCQPLILGYFLTTADVGRYGVAQKLMNGPIQILAALNLSCIPAVGEAWGRGDWPWIHRTFARLARLCALSGLACLVLLLPSSGWITLHWAGPAQVLDLPLYAVMIAQLLVVFWTLPNTVLLGGLHRSKESAQAYLASGLLLPVLVALLVPRLGLMGAAVGTLVSLGLNATLQTGMRRRAVRQLSIGLVSQQREV